MKKLQVLILLIPFAYLGYAQDIHFSQFFEAPQSVNPALTGYFVGEHRIIVNYRDQWKSMGSPYNTYAFSYDVGVKKSTAKTGYLAIGGMFYNDEAGALNLKTTQGILNLAYHLKVSDNQTLGAAIQAGFGQKSIDMTAAQWDNQYDVTVGGFNPDLPSGETEQFNSFTYPDLGCGILYTIKGTNTHMTSNDGFRANFGVGAQHINSPKMLFYSGSDSSKLSPRISAHGQFMIGVANSNLAIVPGFMYYTQGKMQEIYFGCNLRYMLKERSRYTGFINDAYFSIGGYHRFAESGIFFAQLEVNGISLGVSYDVNVSNLRNVTSGRGGLELSLKYIVSPKVQRGSFY